jgi:Surp module/Pre-mRNA splicing factor PRP21 like protein
MHHVVLQDLDIMKLTAQFVARNGSEFLSGLRSREDSKREFFFLKDNHSLHTTFKRLTDSYSAVLLDSKEALVQLREDAADSSAILHRWACLQLFAQHVSCTGNAADATALQKGCLLAACFEAQHLQLVAYSYSECVQPIVLPTTRCVSVLRISLMHIRDSITVATLSTIVPLCVAIEHTELHSDAMLASPVQGSRLPLCRCLQRLEWTRVKESEADEVKAEKERERLAMMLIDWHEFSVVRTIDFDPAEDVGRLGPPLSKQMVIQLNKGTDAEPGSPRVLMHVPVAQRQGRACVHSSAHAAAARAAGNSAGAAAP